VSLATAGDRRPRDRRASAFRALLNELKRDEHEANRDLRLAPGTVQLALMGDARAISEAIAAAQLLWPVSPFHFGVINDDTDDGLRLVPAEGSERTSRVLSRANTAYYEYRDTAMSSLSPIRPEWIRMLVVDPDCDPGARCVRWNKGHALHQLTYFLGPVNFYFEAEGRRQAVRMNAGDSAFIPSWIPHSFAAREDTATAAIIAVTFRSRLSAEAVQDLGVGHAGMCGSDLVRGGPITLLRRRLAEASFTPDAVASAAGLPGTRIAAIMSGQAHAEAHELAAIAAVLDVPVSDITPAAIGPGVLIERAVDRPTHAVPSCPGALVVSPVQTPREIRPARALALTISAADPTVEDHRFGLHQFGYVLPGADVLMTWGECCRQVRLRPGDSFYLRPWITHRFARAEEIANISARILSFRAPAAFGADALAELDWLGEGAFAQYRAEQSRWYD
jgi:methylphosphonate synthase